MVPRAWIEERTVHHIGKALENLAGTVKTWSKRSDVVRVASYDGAALDERQTRQKAERHAAFLEMHRQATTSTSDDRTEEPTDDESSP